MHVRDTDYAHPLRPSLPAPSRAQTGASTDAMIAATPRTSVSPELLPAVCMAQANLRPGSGCAPPAPPVMPHMCSTHACMHTRWPDLCISMHGRIHHTCTARMWFVQSSGVVLLEHGSVTISRAVSAWFASAAPGLHSANSPPPYSTSHPSAFRLPHACVTCMRIMHAETVAGDREGAAPHRCPCRCGP